MIDLGKNNQQIQKQMAGFDPECTNWKSLQLSLTICMNIV